MSQLVTGGFVALYLARCACVSLSKDLKKKCIRWCLVSNNKCFLSKTKRGEFRRFCAEICASISITGGAGDTFMSFLLTAWLENKHYCCIYILQSMYQTIIVRLLLFRHLSPASCWDKQVENSVSLMIAEVWSRCLCVAGKLESASTSYAGWSVHWRHLVVLRLAKLADE